MRFEQSASKRASNMLARLGMVGRDNASGDKVSMGQARRVAIARAVEAGARLLFLDEPLGSLDASGAKEVTTLLKELAHRASITLVVIEHVLNAPLILDFANSVWTLKDATLSVETPALASTQVATADRNGSLAHIQNALPPNARFLSNTSLDGADLSVFGLMDGKQETPVLEVTDLVVYRGRRLVIGTRTKEGGVRGISFALYPGTLAVLLAANGWGKTTLLEAIAGLIPIASGEIRFGGISIQTLPPWRRVALGISFLQARNHDFPSLTVGEVLRLSHLCSLPEKVAHLHKRLMSNLSGGEKQKVAVLTTLGKEPSQLSLMDEPFSNLDRNALDETSTLLQLGRHSVSFIALPSTNR